LRLLKNRQITPVDKKALELAADDLTDRQRAFVDNLFTPGITQEDAAIKAGYSVRSASVAASRNLRLTKVLEYLDVCVNQGIRGMAIGASMVVKDLSDQAKSDYVKLQAAQDILNRSGHGLDDKAVVNVGELTVNIDLS
jgi:phage terminase small subunit